MISYTISLIVKMNTLTLVLSLYFVQIVLSHGLTNLFGFYTGFRKLCLCRCGISNGYSNYLRNGRSISSDTHIPHFMPWLARIHTSSSTFRGTLLSDRHVITAASPIYRKSASEITVILGANDVCKGGHTFNISVNIILIHPGYSPHAKNNDVALLKLTNPVQFSEFISPICMPVYDAGEFDQLAWTTSSIKNGPDLCSTRISTLPILPNRNCYGHNSSIELYDKSCLGPLGTKSIICENDIGGPVMSRWLPGSPFRLVGIISNATCDKDAVGLPLFTRTVDNMLWIHEHIRSDCQCF